MHALIDVRDPAIRDRTTFGRILVNAALPAGFEYLNDVIGPQHHPIGAVVDQLVSGYPRDVAVAALDRLKELGFRFGAQSGLTISIDDVVTPPAKAGILARCETDVAAIGVRYARGQLSDRDRRDLENALWSAARDDIQHELEDELRRRPDNPVAMMLESGARGNIDSLRAIAGMKGQVVNVRNEIVPRPITSCFREGLSVLEYFLSTHGSRKGRTDSALGTAAAGYLTRRLHDAAHDVVVGERDCGTVRGTWVDVSAAHADTRLLGRPEVGRVRVRSVLTCESTHGVCARCYGTSPATGRLVELGEAVGTIAAQSIGEPATQLVLRSFHRAGDTGADITDGLPRVVELLEARTPKGGSATGPY